MTSTQLINRVVVGGRTVTDPITKRVSTKTGETTVTTFLLGVSGGARQSPVRIEIEAWASVSTVAQLAAKGRRVIVDGHLTMSEFVDRYDQKQRRYAIRADVVTFLDSPPNCTGEEPGAASGNRDDERHNG